MLSLYNDSKKLYEDTLKIQQELIDRFGNDKINEKKSLASPNEIIITGIPENINDKPIIIAEKVFESIGIEVAKTAIISSINLKLAIQQAIVHQQIKISAITTSQIQIQ